MSVFKIKFSRVFEVSIEAEHAAEAAQLAFNSQPKGEITLLSIIAEDYVERPCAACEAGELHKPQPPGGGRPHPGGTPGTPTLKAPEIVDQIAKAA